MGIRVAMSRAKEAADKAAVIGSLPRGDRGELMSWHARLLAAEIGAKSKGPTPHGIDLPDLFGLPIRAGGYGVMAFLVNEVFLQRSYDVGPLPPEPVIIDCGANIGVASLFFAHHYPGSQVLAFEPDPEAFSLLTHNTAALDGVTAHNLALGRENGTIDFYVRPEMPGAPTMSGIEGRLPNGTRIAVDCVRLSSMMPASVDLLKIDVEGMEWEILDDLEDSGAIDRVHALAIEYHHHLPKDRDDLAAFLGRLESAGFGYQIGAARRPGQLGDRYQDVMIYGYRKQAQPA